MQARHDAPVSTDANEPEGVARALPKARVKRKFIRTRQVFRVDGAFAFDIGLRTKNESNQLAPNWRVISGRRKQQRTKVMKALEGCNAPLLIREVTFVRYAPGVLDDDGLRSALKSVRDQALCWLQGNNTLKAKADDGPGCGLTFIYAQYRQREYGVRIVFK